LRELTIKARASGIDPRQRYKVHNLVLAAPDLDLQVAHQRIVGDQLSLSVHRFTVYASPRDRALGTSRRLFRSPRGRLGTLGIEGLPDEVADLMDYSGSNLAIVSFDGASDATPSEGDRWGHSYFRDAPTVSSDVVLMLRDDLDPGPPGRPLEKISRKFWRVPPGYPANEVD
jgi:esterase/lipase superfamily enzyme